MLSETLRALGPSDLELIDLLAVRVELSAGRCSLAKTPGKDNWVDEVGGLPDYICRIARALHRERGFPVSQAIAIAVGRVKRWAAGGDDVDPDTRAKAARALAQWEAKKARAKADGAKGG